MSKIYPKIIPELICSNLKESLDFYVNVLGFEIDFQRPERLFAMLERQGVSLMLEEFLPDRWLVGELEKPYGRGINFQMETTDVQSLRDTIEKHGYSFFKDMHVSWYRKNDVLLEKIIADGAEEKIKDPAYMDQLWHLLA